jgi:hypothetical protein
MAVWLSQLSESSRVEGWLNKDDKSISEGVLGLMQRQLQLYTQQFVLKKYALPEGKRCFLFLLIFPEILLNVLIGVVYREAVHTTMTVNELHGIAFDLLLMGVVAVYLFGVYCAISFASNGAVDFSWADTRFILSKLKLA